MKPIEINKGLLSKINSIKYDRYFNTIAVISDNLIAIDNDTTIDIVDL
jgi:hypothetical protein